MAPPGSAELGRTRFAPERLAANRVPALFVVGARDPIFPPRFVERASGYLAGSRTQTIPGAGHSPYYEQPRLWEQVVTAFLEEAD